LLWASWKLGKVRVALLFISIATFLPLFGEIEEQGGIAGKLLYASKSIIGRVETGL
jgi:hypothetical protein